MPRVQRANLQITWAPEAVRQILGLPDARDIRVREVNYRHEGNGAQFCTNDPIEVTTLGDMNPRYINARYVPADWLIDIRANVYPARNLEEGRIWNARQAMYEIGRGYRQAEVQLPVEAGWGEDARAHVINGEIVEHYGGGFDGPYPRLEILLTMAAGPMQRQVQHRQHRAVGIEPLNPAIYQAMGRLGRNAQAANMVFQGMAGNWRVGGWEDANESYKQARIKARETLLDLLSPRNRKMLNDRHHFIVEGSEGSLYRIDDHGISGNVHWIRARRGHREGESLGKFCLHASNTSLPIEDHMILQMLLVTTDEEAFIRTAVLQEGTRPEWYVKKLMEEREKRILAGIEVQPVADVDARDLAGRGWYYRIAPVDHVFDVGMD